MQNLQGRQVMVQGRIVWVSGDLFKGKQKVDPNTRQPVMGKNGPVTEFGFGLAVRKVDLQNTGKGQPGEVWAAMFEEARTIYPSGLPPTFAMKYKDGDTDIDHNGVPFRQRKGYEGCIVLNCLTTLPIKFVKWDTNTKTNVVINEGIKCGDYVNVQLNIKAHPPKGQGKPGLYLNPMFVQFLGYGEEIVSASSGDMVFGNQAPPMYPGASEVPVAQPGFLGHTGAPSFPVQPAAQQPAAPAPTVSPSNAAPQAPQQPLQPHYGVLPPQHQPQAPQAPMGNVPAYPGTQQAGSTFPAPGGFPTPGQR